jgi:Nucleotidyl transferase AbiEii toxin, Type IV TA system
VNKPSRKTTAGATYLDLQRMAKADGRATDELLTLYALEGFLDRLSTAPQATDLILKGGVLLAAYETRRPTRDVDLQATDLNNDANVGAITGRIWVHALRRWVEGAGGVPELRPTTGCRWSMAGSHR